MHYYAAQRDSTWAVYDSNDCLIMCNIDASWRAEQIAGVLEATWNDGFAKGVRADKKAIRFALGIED